ncbi:MAG TPA: hypothetical protein VMV46_14595 [Thermoanaerobaculia bacterium]|nr:hypothetical protein [Thermoanaerobaculia bacterium]
MAEHQAHRADHGHGDPDPELQVSPVAKVLVAIALIGLVAAALMWPLVHGFARSSMRRVPAERIDESRPGGPRLQTAPEQDMRAFRAREAIALHSYGWVDESAGVARIPVERAAELVLEEGLPATPAAAPGTQGSDPDQSPPSPEEQR